eukprot:CAMPEP_0119015678 /NCGR_PEP_ID=MMETSP1176-20130426/11398_1 /TAXON_ID=265551 /ORGANISM="Synedropsis recta cf, Strain CCMP1620" /LENGTH=482 /DNA_ID=CAMNT_0006968989 /DNA_START=80 /DNA_END=1528 /DNA_ORIENTATION=+
MNKYHVHLALSIIALLVVCLAIFVLFRHIEIRKLELANSRQPLTKTLNADGTEGPVVQAKKRHNRKDDVVIVLRVFLMIVLLVLLVDEDQGSRWITLVIAYLLVVFLSLIFLAKGTEIPQNVRERKWEYLSLFSFLVFAAGAAIALIGHSALMSQYGKSYFGAARIVAYNDNENDDDDAADEEDDDANNEEDDDNEEEDDEENDDEDDNEEEEEDEDDEEEDNDDEDDNQDEEDDGDEDDGDEDRRLEDGDSGDEDDNEDSGDEDDGDEDNDEDDNDSEDDSDSEDNDSSGSEDQGDAQENAYIKVAFGGQWGCPSSPDTYCEAEIETSCDEWDLDVSSAYNSNPANWKYWAGDADSRLDGTFSCGYGFQADVDDASYDPDTSPDTTTTVYSGGDDDANNNNGDFPYGYIVGDCNTCSAQWAWAPYYRRYEEIEGHKALYRNYMALSGISLVCYGLASFGRKFTQKRAQKVSLISNEGGVSV